jgi:integrase
MTAKRKRRSPGEGSVWRYRMKNRTERWAIAHPSFGTRRVDREGEGWYTKTAAQDALRAMITDAKRGKLVDPSKQAAGTFLDEWVAGHPEIGESTRASYAKNIRLHIKPYIGDVPLCSLTSANVTTLYRKLLTSGRADYREGEGLSPRTVRYVATILRAALQSAVESKPPLLEHNPADHKQAKPPRAKRSTAAEVNPWNAAQLGAFLAWSAEHSQMHAAWHLLAMTGMRRGEALALRWRHVDLEAATASVQKSAGVLRVKGEGASVVEGDTKTGKPRVIDLDAGTVALLRSHRRARGAVHLNHVRDDALVFGDHEGGYLHPERVTRTFKADVERCRAALGEAGPPVIRLHDLRHTHASLLLAKGVPVKVVSERLGHSSATVTLTVYAHVMPGNQRQAADLFASLIKGAGA